VTVISDGSVAGTRMGWAALVATPSGVLAHTSGALVADLLSSWAAEWVGKLEGILLDRRLGYPMPPWPMWWLTMYPPP
jgi:hypothetical protein